MKSSVQNAELVKGLIDQATYLSNSLNDLLSKTEDLIKEGFTVDTEIKNSCKFREDHWIKYLVENLKDEEQLQLLRMNIELKRTVDEYQLGVEQIMAKYKEHCEGDVLSDSFSLRDKYISDLTNVVKAQDQRIEEMANLMSSCAIMAEQDSVENQEIMRNLMGENEQIRYQLQISNAMKQFVQGSKPSNESGTQFTENDLDTSESNSFSSLESFMSCLSSGCDSASTTSSVVSQIEVSRFIEQALAEIEVKVEEELPSAKDSELEVIT